jgi:transposase-like protein
MVSRGAAEQGGGAAGSPDQRSEVVCPFCDSTNTVEVSAFGCQHLTSHYQCRACRSYFEAVRDDR